MNFIFLHTLIILLRSIASETTHRPIEINVYDNFQFDCNFILSSMIFRYNHRCVQLIVQFELYPLECIRTIMENYSKNVTFYVRSMDWLLRRNIHVEESLENITKKQSTRFCENFLILLRDVNLMRSLLKSLKNNGSIVRIFPYSKLYFLFAGDQLVLHETLAEFSNFFFENAQFGYAFEFDGNTSTIRLRDFLLLTNESISQSNLFHPILNRDNDQKEFRLSLFDCYPYIIYIDEDNLRFDGIEYHLVQEVVKNWKIKHILRDESKTGITPWITVFDDLKTGEADLALCSLWAIFDDNYDVSTYYNHECNTLMVPKPKRLSEMSAIYATLNGYVWLTFGFLFFAMGILLRSGAILNTTDVKRDIYYANMSNAFLDVMSIATLHGVGNFWRHQSSTKILLMSWILVSSLVGIGYTTVYTSRLTKPGYTKVINTIEEFIENDMFWGTFHIHADVQAFLNLSANPAYRELNRRIFVFKNVSDAETGLATEQYGIYAGISNGKYFVTYDWNELLHLISSFRMMKQICIFDFYTAFTLQRFSPYTDLFSYYALLFSEHGITQFWFSTVYRENEWMVKFFEDYPRENNQPEVLHFSSISGALLLLFVSHLMSILVFTCELAVQHCMRSPKVNF